MIVALNIVKSQNNSFFEKFKSVFKPYDIYTDIISRNDIKILYIKYIQKRKKVNFKKIYECTIGYPKTIICSDKISLENTSFKRFKSNDFNVVMMKNFIMDILKSSDIAPSRLKISFYDPNAEYPLFAEELLDYTSQLTIVSNMPRFYENESERYMNEHGISVIVSNSVSKLMPCDILIAPSEIKCIIPTASSSLIFTSYRPSVPVSGTVMTQYIPEFPYEYSDLKPDFVDGFYFLSALYTMCGLTKLEDLIPVMCESGNKFLYKEQIIKKLKAKTLSETNHECAE